MPDPISKNQLENSEDERQKLILDWLQSVLGTGNYDLHPASSDASFRRYFRTVSGDETVIIMDAPPDKEDSEPFIRVADLMHEAGLNAPRVLAKNLEQGFLLLSDMGSQTYMSQLSVSNPDALMSDAIDALIIWQSASKPNVLPAYDRELLQRELSLFPEWYVGKHLDKALTGSQLVDWKKIVDVLVEAAIAQPQVFVHRDYMPRNLMFCHPNPGVLDFQDAVEGPLAYDVLSLFKDAFLSWTPEQVVKWRHEYWKKAESAGLPVPALTDFIRDFDLIGMQRHLKVLGIFARINYRDGKPHYLEDTPRFIRYIREVAPFYSEMAPLMRIFDDLGMEV